MKIRTEILEKYEDITYPLVYRIACEETFECMSIRTKICEKLFGITNWFVYRICAEKF